MFNFSVECFCGMEKPSQLKRLPDSSCNMKCSGNPKYSCGGYLTINVFWTGIQSKEVNTLVHLFTVQ